MRNVDLIINSDGTKVICKRMIPGVEVVNLLDRLQDLQVREGFSKEQLKEIVDDINNSGETKTDVIVAEVPELEISFDVFNVELAANEIRDFSKDLKGVAEKLRRGDGTSKPSNVYFVKLNDSVVTIQKKRKNVYGMEVMVTLDKDFIEYNEDAFAQRENEDSVTLIAQRFGYLTMNDRLQMDIKEPQSINTEETELRYILHPCEKGQDAMILRFLELSRSEDRSLEEEEIRALVASNISKTVICRKRLEPDMGRNAEVVIHYVSNRDRTIGESEKVDHKEYSMYDMVKEGDVICEKLLKREGIPGEDIYGSPIPVNPVEDCEYVVGENIQIETQDDSILYKADKDGIVEVNQKMVNVDTRLNINSDVGQETGNVTFEYNVVIKKDLKEGFKISCKGDCIVGGNVENGAIIECGGDLIVKRGVFGLDTRIIVKGDAQVGFIQEAKVNVGNNLIVESFIYHAHIFAGNNIEVTGNKIKGDIKGSVIGGEVNAFNSLILHSVGSPATTTSLCAGVNINKLRKMHELRKGVAFCDKEVNRFKMFRGIDLTSLDAAKKISVMNAASKQFFKMAIGNIKKLLDKKKALNMAITTIEGDIFHDNVNECEILVKNHIMPEIQLRIGTAILIVKSKDAKKCFNQTDTSITSRPFS